MKEGCGYCVVPRLKARLKQARAERDEAIRKHDDMVAALRELQRQLSIEKQKLADYEAQE